MKKHLLILASLVLGFGQLFADDVTFSVGDLKATLPSNNTNIAIPYTWDGAPAPVTVTIAKQDASTASLGVSTVIALTNAYEVTVSLVGNGTLNSIKFTTNPASQTANVTASTGSYASSTWTPGEDETVSSVTFTCTGTFRLTQIAVDYTKTNSGNDPVSAWTQELTVGVGQTGQVEFTMDGTPKAVTYTSSNTKVATVAANGKVTGVAVGTCTVSTIIDEENGNRWTKETAVTVVQPEAALVANAATYTGSEPFICDYLTKDIYALNNLGKYEKWGVMESVNDLAGVTTYEGKLVVNNSDNCEYKFVGGAWVNVGSVLPQEIITETNYKNMSLYNEETNPDGGWYCRWGYQSTFDKFVYDAETNTNTIDPYEGQGGWEPYQSFNIEGLNPGDTYKVSFKYTGTAWHSWSSYTKLPFYVLNNPDFGSTLYVEEPNSEVLAVALLPNTETTNKEYVLQFVADKDFCVLAVQFGVGQDGAQGFKFSFADLKIERVPVVEQYVNNFKLVSIDNGAYTPLAYIENISAARENAYTLPYIPVTATQIGMKFKVYDTSSGWSAIFCARNTHAGTGISLYMNGNDRAHFGYFTGGTTGSGDNFAPFSLNTDYEVSADVTKLVVNGETYETGNTVTNATTRALSLFANPEWDNPMRGRIEYCTISEAEETLFNFKPAMRHDGVFGFYDAASGLFVLPAQGKLDGYGYKKLDDQAYVTYTNETRLVIAGNTAQFLPDVQNLDDATFTWTSADESIATVAADGTVTGVAAGKVMITVTTDADQGWTASYELTVSEPDYKRFDKNNVGYAIVTGGNGWGDSPVVGLVDNDANTKFGCGGTGDAWAIIIASEPVAVQQYSLVTGADTYNYPSRNPVSWKLEGSNDNQTWTLIDEKVQTYQLKSFNKYENVVDVEGTEAYKFFKFSVTQIADGFQLGELWINEQTHSFGEEATVLYAPTCATEGKTAFACTDCGAVNIESIAPLGHDYVEGVCSRCSAKVSEVVLLPNRGNDNTPYFAKYRHANAVVDGEYADIEEGWATADFDDSDWDELMLPLGSFGPYHTRWFGDYNTFWFRRSFNIDDPSTIAKLTLRATHDDDYAVFLNGTKITQEYNWTNGENDFRVVDVDPTLLVPGKNVLAMYIEQNWGGAYCDFGLEAQLGANVKVGDALYATFVAPCDVDFTDAGVSAFAAQPNGKYVHLEPVTTVPAGTAVVVKADEAGSYYAPKTIGAALGTENALLASETPVTADGSQFVLAKPEGEEVGFYQVIENTVISPKTGYLVISGEGVKGFYGFDPDNGTGIKGIDFADENAPIYNVAGQRLQKMQKGINIVGGQKVLK